MENKPQPAEYYANMLVVGNTGGVDVATHNLSVIKLAMTAGGIEALGNAVETLTKAESN